MDIEFAVERIHRLVTTKGEALRAEEAIKASLVMPFLAGLGHDPFDPDQVVAGYKSGGSKVDFATMGEDGEASLLICVTSTPADLATQRAANLRAALAESGLMGLLTDGREFRFHALLADRGMVSEPFLAFDLSEAVIDAEILSPLARGSFDVDEAIASGRLTKLPLLAQEALLKHLEEGAEIREFLAAGIVRNGIATDASRAAVEEVLLRTARVLRGEEPAVMAPEPEPEIEEEDESRRALSGDEEAAYKAVVEIASRYVDGARIHARPAQAYLAVLLDDNNRRSICRLYFSAHSTRYIGTFTGRDEKKHRIQGYTDIPGFAQDIEARLRELDPGAFDGRGADISTGSETTGSSSGSADGGSTAIATDASADDLKPVSGPDADGGADGGEGIDDAGADGGEGIDDAGVDANGAGGADGEGVTDPTADRSGADAESADGTVVPAAPTFDMGPEPSTNGDAAVDKPE